MNKWFAVIVLVFLIGLPVGSVAFAVEYSPNPSQIYMYHYTTAVLPNPWYIISGWTFIEEQVSTITNWVAITGNPNLQAGYDGFALACVGGGYPNEWVIFGSDFYQDVLGTYHYILYQGYCGEIRTNPSPLTPTEIQPVMPDVVDAFTTVCAIQFESGMTAHVDTVDEAGNHTFLSVPVYGNSDGTISVPFVVDTGEMYSAVYEVWLDYAGHSAFLSSFTINGLLWMPQQGIPNLDRFNSACYQAAH